MLSRLETGYFPAGVSDISVAVAEFDSNVEVMYEMREVGLGYVGVGLMGEGHIYFSRQLPYVKPVAVADTDLGRAKEVAAKYAIPNVYSDYHRLMENEDVEAVVIATPEDVHRGPAVAAAESGKHMLLEKPMAHTLQDANAIADACRKSGIKTMIGYVYRFFPQMSAVKGFVDEGLLGEPVTAAARIDGDISEGMRLKGRTTVQLYVGVHVIDLLLWYLQDNVISVYAEAADGELMREFGVHDSLCMLLRFRSGTVAYVQCGWGAPTNWAGWKKPSAWSSYYGNITPHNIQLVGTKGIAEVSLPPEGVYAADQESVGVKLPSLVAPLAYRLQIEYFLQCLREDKTPSAGCEEGYRSLEVALAATKSCAERRPIGLPL